jgi:hypothetical protein
METNNRTVVSFAIILLDSQSWVPLIVKLLLDSLVTKRKGVQYARDTLELNIAIGAIVVLDIIQKSRSVYH